MSIIDNFDRLRSACREPGTAADDPTRSMTEFTDPGVREAETMVRVLSNAVTTCRATT
jgi:hypothetical protein